MDDATRMALAQALMQQGGNPMADYMGKRGSDKDVGGYLNMITGGALGFAGLGTPLALPAGLGGAALFANGMDQFNQADAFRRAQQMWGNTGMPGRPTGE